MARVGVSGLDQIAFTLDEMAAIPEQVMNEMLQAEADVIIQEQKAKGIAYGVYRTGSTIRSIKASKPKKIANGKAILVYPQGTNRRGNRTSEVAFINEYGKRGQKARPFIRDANESAAEKAVSAAGEVYNKWLDSL